MIWCAWTMLANEEASHAGPLALDWKRNALPALAEPIC